MRAAGSHINGQTIIIEVKQPGRDIVKFTPVSCFVMTKDYEGKVIIAKIQVSPDLCTIVSIKIYRLLSLHPAQGAACEEEEDVYSHKTGGECYITIRW